MMNELKLKDTFANLATDETAVTSTEYALMASLIAIVCVAVLISLGGNLDGLYTRVCQEVTTAISGAPAC